MKGIQHVIASNRTAKFEFDLYRNITIVRGNSGTGKTTLYNMIADYTRLGAKSGITVSCTKSCVALIDMDWENQLKKISDSIVFIDEGSDFISTPKFADAIKNTDNYYVIFNREGLHNLPYSVNEIYEIKTSGKYHKFEKMFTANEKHIYSYKRNRNIRNKETEYNILLTEDSHSGFQFFEHCLKDSEIRCMSSGSNSAIFSWLKNHKDENVLVVGDGAAFGSEIDRVMKLQTSHPDSIKVCLPESFEWLILKSDLIKENNIHAVLDNPSEYIDSAEYFSWENFFTDYLVQITLDTPMKYTKSKINPAYLNKNSVKAIIKELPITDSKNNNP